MKIVAFVLFGNQEIYNCGAVANARLVNKIYPGWVSMFFVGPSVQESTKEALRQLGAQVHEISGPETMSATIWRFRAALIPGVERIVFRDCDSRLTQRERECVAQWELSETSLHIIRDHPWHTASILAGMWGVFGEQAIRVVADVADEINQISAPYGVDQEILALKVYPKLVSDSMTHDAFYNFEKNTIRPPQRIGLEFIGERIDCSEGFDVQNRKDLQRIQKNPLARAVLRLANRRKKS
jgi:hypothetical protein